ncbi:uncharacterized protein LOC119728104 [Patiria miniata]|uniref:Uncharacterized protein n=1 Tax=Patiria miniata TaxID=46514 RepID=A0A913ZXR5_PATMI|nr:uncharacterized protein LOC119728104 [Patiria miniata]
MQPVAPIQSVQMQMPPTAPSRRSRYSCAVKSLGVLQIILSGVSAIVGVVAGFTGSVIGLAFAGTWGAILFFLPAGILGVLSVTLAVGSRRCLAIACMVMCILASVMAAANIGQYGASMAFDGYYYGGGGYYYYTPVPIAMDGILVVVSLTELVVSITASVYCCYVMSEYRPTNPTIQFISTQGNPNMMAYNQPAVAYNQPAVPYTVTPAAPGTFVANQPYTQPPSYTACTTQPGGM